MSGSATRSQSGLVKLLGDDLIDDWGTLAVYVPVGGWALQAGDCSRTEYSG